VTIAFLSVSPEMGGSEVCLLQLVRGIRRAERTWPLVVVVPREGTLAQRARQAGADVHVLPLPASLARLGESGMRTGAAIARSGARLVAAATTMSSYRRSLAQLLADVEADLVHTNGLKLHVLGARAAHPGTPLVWHVHEYVSPRPITRVLLKRHASRASAIVANSRSVADDLRAVVGTNAPVTAIYNAVDLDEFSPHGPVADLDELSGLAPAPPNTIRIGLLATFGRWKGHDPFLRAMRQVSAAVPVRGYIIGGPLYDTSGSQHTLAELERRAADLGLADRIGFTGFIERPAAALRALDIVVHASTQPEPFGLVIAEAMACRRAVIVSAAGGAAELVRDGVDALTHSPGDVDALAAAIQRCVDSAELRTRLADEAHRVAQSRFDPAAFTASFRDLYRRLEPAAASVK
jgi:glycosyltransferase involved in cell wall biosynthesis